MAHPRRPPLLSLWLLLVFAATAANALHFYLDTNEKRCFVEELPTDTIVEGHYRALEWSESEQKYVENPNLGILVEVDELETGHNVVKTRGPSDGRFTFTSHDSGDHSICLSSNYGTSWFSSTHIRLYFDIVIGTTKADTEHDRSHVSELSQKLRDLNMKIEDINREQQYQREREAAFRNLSEETNSRAVWYTLVQIGVLVATCVWQLRHLRRFFEDRKMH
ncbi:emp24/gp25L/p24 family/GOLD-domain-containing protein [Trametes maxima]|nr:emp24/gp25L/p24 family/GOLD-domain-containing protein [Trametes maxima]